MTAARCRRHGMRASLSLLRMRGRRGAMGGGAGQSDGWMDWDNRPKGTGSAYLTCARMAIRAQALGGSCRAREWRAVSIETRKQGFE